MSYHVETHAFDRAALELAIGHAARLERRRGEWEEEQFAERETHFQLPISGIAGTIRAWSTIAVKFDVAFMFAPEQRDSPLPYPNFVYGPVVNGTPSPDGNPADPDNPDSLVDVTCHVTDWVVDHGGDAVVGAVIGAGVVTSGQRVRFDGHLHLRFEGWGVQLDQPGSVDG